MEQNKESSLGILEKLALITDGIQNIFPDGKGLLIFELKELDFKKVQSNFRKIDENFKKFTIDISGIEVVFILEGYIEEKKKDTTKKEKRNFLQMFINIFRKRSKLSI